MSPRAASAKLVATALDFIRGGSARVVDVGTGTGALAIAIACAAPRALLWATDTSADAVAATRANVLRHGLADRIIVCHADLLDPVPSPIDLVVANLPYLRPRTRRSSRISPPSRATPSLQGVTALSLTGGC
jgi:release factor glutamine methyltransferase